MQTYAITVAAYHNGWFAGSKTYHADAYNYRQELRRAKQNAAQKSKTYGLAEITEIIRNDGEILNAIPSLLIRYEGGKQIYKNVL